MYDLANLPVWGILLKSTIAIALAALACRLLGRQSAAMRHRVWAFGLAASLVIPIVSLLLPQMTLPVLPNTLEASWVVTTQETGDRSSTSPAELSRPDSTRDDGTRDFTLPLEIDAPSSPAAAADVPLPMWSLMARPSDSSGRSGIEQALVLTWLFGTVLGSILFLISLIRHSIWLSRLRKIDDNDWVDSVAIAGKALGVIRPIVTLESDRATVPAVVGAICPRLVVPANWRTWSPTQRHCILLHELAHVKRRDVATQLLGRLAVLAYWFNPLIWHAVRQLRAERELASDDCVLLAGQPASDYAEQLLLTLKCYRPARPVMGVAMAHSARLDERVLAILDPARRRNPVGARFALILPCIVCLIGSLLSGISLTAQVTTASPADESNPASTAANAIPVWKENYTVEYPGALPVSVAFSADGKTLLTGDTAGEIMALIFGNDDLRWRWKSQMDGSHAAVAFSADQKQVYAATEHGIRILDAAFGKEVARIDVADSRPTAIGVFPNKTIAETFVRTQIVFGNPRGYFVKAWAEGKLADTISTIQTSTVAKDAKPADEGAVPLAVDPNGRCAIMTGPVDATGEAGGVKGKNVLWAYVCGDYEDGSPGNRLMAGHTETVVSAAWSKEGGTAVTGDASGRVIVWDAKTMQETRRLELGGRVAALAISNDGTRTAAYVLGRQGYVYLWETAKPIDGMKPIHTDLASFEGPTSCASLSFSPDGTQLAGCASDKRWLNFFGRLIGKVRVWELAAEPKGQLAPKQSYVKALSKGIPPNFIVIDNNSILIPAEKEGALDFRRLADGDIQARIVLGQFAIGGMKRSADHKWMAMEQHSSTKPSNDATAAGTFEVRVCELPMRLGDATIPACRQLLDIASGGKVVAVVRQKQVELWETATTRRLKELPLTHARIDAASFSPDGTLLVFSAGNDLVIWNWETDTHERFDITRKLGSLTFSPDGRFLAEGPSSGEAIQIRDMETKAIVRSLTTGTKSAMNVPRMVYAQGGRVLIACDNSVPRNKTEVRHRIILWDMADGSIAHQLTVAGGLPQMFEVSPNGRHLIAAVEGNGGVSLIGWRLDGAAPAVEAGPTPPAAARPR